jgi:hypothetical protein
MLTGETTAKRHVKMNIVNFAARPFLAWAHYCSARAFRRQSRAPKGAPLAGCGD